MTHHQLVAALLNSQTTLALATVAEDGSPHIAPLFYLAGEALDLCWLSSASSVHSRNLKRNPAAAVAVYSPAASWREIRGVQMRGPVTVVHERAERHRIVEAYVERFQLGALFRARIARSRIYRFQPEWIRYLDNTAHFGYKFELTIGASDDPRSGDCG
ncbi:MAG: pyridoxamine 5'-phosphate oxidase family protein [Bryobacteraceae bacterium]|nr:pyridoxamine 5'-phosphate oxidase family protein [Bryobacteraceae bacterium]